MNQDMNTNQNSVTSQNGDVHQDNSPGQAMESFSDSSQNTSTPDVGGQDTPDNHAPDSNISDIQPDSSAQDGRTEDLSAAVEAIVFASGEPIETERICFALDIDRRTAEETLQTLADIYNFERRGIRLLRISDSWQLCSAPEHADAIRKAFEIKKSAKLSQPALEVLAVIAYYQPVTRAYIEKLRGVDSSYTVGLLLNRNLIEECGRLAAPGRPRLYRTTEQFLRSFHMSSLDDLPEIPDFIAPNPSVVSSESEASGVKSSESPKEEQEVQNISLF